MRGSRMRGSRMRGSRMRGSRMRGSRMRGVDEGRVEPFGLRPKSSHSTLLAEN